MNNLSVLHTELTAKSLITNDEINVKIIDFAKQLGWNPSYFLPPDNESEDFANGYLSIEHGLENTAILAFLNKPYFELNTEQRKKLDSIAYNNLVSWLIPIDKSHFSYIYILNSQKRIIEENRILPDNFENLKCDKFLQIIGKKPNANIPALDDSLITTITYWKRLIAGELNELNNEKLSMLFNSIIFTRAIEDNNKRFKNSNLDRQLLLKTFNELKTNGNPTICEILKTAISKFTSLEIISDLIDFEKLLTFDKLEPYLVYKLINQFYETENNNFTYDFSIMTKHALSRIYEKYVSILRFEETPQLSLFNEIPVEKNINKQSGTYYTPEYIARFFAKYLIKQIPVNQFDRIKICEPAVGSGMFLRTLLEVIFENVYPNFHEIDKQIFSNIYGIDIDPNACLATRLSLSLLHLLIYDESPTIFNIINEDSIKYLSENHQDFFDIVISNPPFIRYENNKSDFIKQYLSDISSGKIDSYFAFLKLSIDILKPGGYGLFVIPHSFLVNNGASRLRKLIFENTDIRLIADLSSIPVFGSINTYVILLIFQKKDTTPKIPPAPIKIKCKNLVGKALEETLNNIQVSTENYSIYKGNYRDFEKNEWFILPPNEYIIEQKFQSFPTIDKYLDIKQGFITGADDIFIRDKIEIKNEEQIYLNYIPDKELRQYELPKQLNKYVFYPYINGIKITELQLQNDYPKTWLYLSRNKPKLESRSSIGNNEFWFPTSPRQPQFILKPKIILPELSIIPKFSLDIEGNIAVSHSCYLILKSNYQDLELLYYFLGILNSTACYWYISNHSNKYGSGYNKIQPKTLRNTPVPDPFELDKLDLLKLIKLVKERLNCKEDKKLSIEKEIDILVSKLYKLDEKEIEILLGL